MEIRIVPVLYNFWFKFHVCTVLCAKSSVYSEKKA